MPGPHAEDRPWQTSGRKDLRMNTKPQNPEIRSFSLDRDSHIAIRGVDRIARRRRSSEERVR
jgi:hypothetical protein